MIKLTITARGRITLNRELLKHLGVSPGEKIEVDKLPNVRIRITATPQDGNIKDFIGCLSRRVGPKLTIEKINEVATQGWAKPKRKSRQKSTCLNDRMRCRPLELRTDP